MSDTETKRLLGNHKVMQVNDGDAEHADGEQPNLEVAKKKVPFWVIALALIVVQTGFGAYGVIVYKFARFAHANAIVFSFYRDVGCWPVLLLTGRILEGPLRFPNSWKDLGLFMSLGLTGMFGGQLFYILGVFFAGPDVASIYQPAMPVWAAVFVIIVGAEKVPNVCTIAGLLKVFGVLLAAGGAVTMGLAETKKGKGGSTAAAGGMLSLLNTVLFAMYVTIQKKYIFMRGAPLKHRWGEYPVYVTAWSYGFGAMYMVAGAVISYYTSFGLLGFGKDEGACDVNATHSGLGCPYQNATTANSTCTKVAAHPTCLDEWIYVCRDGLCHLKTNTLSIPDASVGPIVYAVFITSALNYGLITFCNKNCSTSVVSAFWPFQVFVAVALSFLVLGESLEPLQIVGAVLIIFGLAAVIKSNHDSPADL
eukprot:m.178966 g.178966  ORF g.178966 m.178966 type:complete len:422 (+) comp31953_c7_seq1:329-1594(+)